ncbi:unnamed protein product [Ectocarpus sp. 12 AP-2014]
MYTYVYAMCQTHKSDSTASLCHVRVTRVAGGQRCWWTAAARVCDVCQALRAPYRKGHECWHTAVVELPGLKSRHTARNHLS